MYLTEFSEHLSFYEMSKKWELRFGHFSAFFELFWPFLGTVVINTKPKKVADGIDLNL